MGPSAARGDPSLPFKGCYRFRYRDAATGATRVSGCYQNVVCLTGKALIAAWLNGEGAMPTPLYGAVGTGSGTPGTGDSALFAELQRVALASSTRGSNVVTLDFFFSTGQANGTLTECGLFLAASAAANSGSLLSHALISEVKTSTETLTVEFTITVG